MRFRYDHPTARAMRNVFRGGVASVAVVSRVSDLIPSLSEVVNKVAVNLEAGNHMMLLGDLGSDKTFWTQSTRHHLIHSMLIWLTPPLPT
jgi:hypothetical protein